VRQLLELYHQELVPLLGIHSAPVGDLLLQWLPAAHQAINNSGQPLAVQQTVMQLLSRMVHVLICPAAGSNSSGCSSLSGDVACTPASCNCELVFSMVEGLLRSLEGLSVLCSCNSCLWMEPSIVGITMQQWRALLVQQPALPAGWLIHQLLQQLGA
jgi:hypothetical protein